MTLTKNIAITWLYEIPRFPRAHIYKLNGKTKLLIKDYLILFADFSVCYYSKYFELAIVSHLHSLS